MVEWITSDAPVPHLDTIAWMEARATAIATGEADQAIWLLEHLSLYTAGTSARAEYLRNPDRFRIHQIRHGG